MTDLDADGRVVENRAHTDATFRTSDDRVVAIGDSALLDQDDDAAPPSPAAIRSAIHGEEERVADTLDRVT